MNVLLGFGERRSLSLNGKFIGTRIEPEEHVAFLQGHVRRHRHLDNRSADGRNHRSRCEIDAAFVREGMIVTHQKHKTRNDEYAAQRGRRHRPFVYRDPEDLEDRVAYCGVGKNEKKVHQSFSSTREAVFSTTARCAGFSPGKRCSSLAILSSNCTSTALGGTTVSPCWENPQPRSGR